MSTYLLLQFVNEFGTLYCIKISDDFDLFSYKKHAKTKRKIKNNIPIVIKICFQNITINSNNKERT